MPRPILSEPLIVPCTSPPRSAAPTAFFARPVHFGVGGEQRACAPALHGWPRESRPPGEVPGFWHLRHVSEACESRVRTPARAALQRWIDAKALAHVASFLPRQSVA